MRIVFISDHQYPKVCRGAEISMHLLEQELTLAGHDVESHLWTKGDGRQRLRRRIAGADWVFTQLRVAPVVVEECRRLHVRVAVFVRSLAEHVCRCVKNGLHVCSETGERAEPLTCSLKCFRKPGNTRTVTIQRRMFRDADAVFTSSEYTSAVIRRVFGRADARVAYPPIAEPRSPDADHRYLTISRPSVGKGRAVFEALVERMPAKRFLAVGGPPLKPAPNLEQRPECVDMTDVYRATRILLAPSVNCETFGRVVAEAGSFGVPSVVSRQGGLPEAVGPGGIAVEEFENFDAWAEAIEEIEQDYDEYTRKAKEHSQRFRPCADEVLECLNGRPAAVQRTEDDTLTPPTFWPVTLMTGDFPGVAGAFRHLEAVVPFVKLERFDRKVPPPPGLCILGAWRRDYPAYIRKHRRPDVTFALSWHSSWNQIEQGREWPYLAKALDLLRAGHIARLFVSCEETAAVVGRMAGGVEWLPNTLDTALAEKIVPARRPGRHIDLFCSGTPRKNLFAQVAALADADAVLHVNAMNAKAVGPIAKALGVKAAKHNLPRPADYLQVIAGMTAGLQVSLAESFNYVVAEHMLLAVPVLVSRHVPCRPADGQLTVDDEHSPAAIRAKLLPLLDDPGLRDDLGAACHEHITALAAEHNRVATEVLKNAVSEVTD